MRIAIATCRPLPEPDPDQAPLTAALEARGAEVHLAVWDDPAEDWSRYDLCVARSTWDYPWKAEAFAAWLDRAGAQTRLLNPAPVMRWNLHKRYLLELGAAGVPVVPTRIFTRGDAADLSSCGWGDLIVKPAISAGSWKTRRFTEDRAGAVAFLAELLAERDAMVQPYQRSVETSGERSLIFIDGAFSHSIRKEPRWADQDEAVSGPLPAAPEDRALAERILAQIPSPEPLLYGRVDLFRGDDGGPLLSELELMEPSLFLVQHPPALERLVDGLLARA